MTTLRLALFAALAAVALACSAPRQADLVVAQVDEQAMDFTLATTAGAPVTLSEEVAKGPVMLVFYRGDW